MDIFSDEAVRLDLLRRYAKNRWAALPEDVIPLTAADPDFQVAEPIREAIQRVGADGTFSYGADGGSPEFKEAAAGFIRAHKGIDCTASNIHANSGVAQGMMHIARAFLEPGDEAIIFDPVDFLFGRSVDAAGGRRVLSHIDKETRRLDVEGMKELVGPRTRILCICSPHNPLGMLLKPGDLRAMVDLAADHDLVIMSDEIWSDIVYEGRHTATATLPGAWERTVTLYGFSKTFAMAGLQLGYMAAPEPLLDRIRVVAPGYFYPVNTVSLEAGRAAYEEAWGWAEEFIEHLRGVRDYAYGRLSAMPGVSVHKPEATYTLFPDVSSFGLTSIEMTRYMLDEAKVAVVPGHGEGF
ncbi:pyridoxal phosphate-dependent aminotransferase, partial [Candidatus Bathyarchaeota archaeon]|nr:pyridoxal phosphate-dependent aminotransferase [Candidatus Bathyarchaeota archaeon]